VEEKEVKRTCIKEIPLYYGERVAWTQLNPWKDGFINLAFLSKKEVGSNK
jgi:hypothetical protein